MQVQKPNIAKPSPKYKQETYFFGSISEKRCPKSVKKLRLFWISEISAYLYSWEGFLSFPLSKTSNCASFMQRQEKYFKQSQEATLLSRVEKQHPYLMMLYLAMSSIAVIFSFLILLFAFTPTPMGADGEVITLSYPWQFAISCLFIIASSLTLEASKRSFFDDDFQKTAILLHITNILGGLFALFQVLGWLQMNLAGTYFAGHPSGTYLYLVSGLHLAHVLGGMAYLFYYTFQIYTKSKDGIQILIAVTNPYEVLKLRMLRLYWHFLGGLWLTLALLLYIFL
jgi:cytochrome c oxidase subunit III